MSYSSIIPPWGKRTGGHATILNGLPKGSQCLAVPLWYPWKGSCFKGGTIKSFSSLISGIERRLWVRLSLIQDINQPIALLIPGKGRLLFLLYVFFNIFDFGEFEWHHCMNCFFTQTLSMRSTALVTTWEKSLSFLLVSIQELLRTYWLNHQSSDSIKSCDWCSSSPSIP